MLVLSGTLCVKQLCYNDALFIIKRFLEPRLIEHNAALALVATVAGLVITIAECLNIPSFLLQQSYFGDRDSRRQQPQGAS